MAKKDKLEWLNDIYDILVDICKAPETMREYFKAVQSDKDYPSEFRFQGALGFGGKFWRIYSKLDPIYVTCYQEDETPERLRMIDRANAALKQLGDFE